MEADSQTAELEIPERGSPDLAEGLAPAPIGQASEQAPTTASVVDPAPGPVADAASESAAAEPGEAELILARVRGEPLHDFPQDLYIPPEALEVFLEAFEGPLDLLLYLIKRQNIDILDISLTEITRQYMEYVELMKSVRLELAAEYLVMAATLAEIKSRWLLPRSSEEEDDDADPRAELIRRLQEYERFKQAAEDIGSLPRMEREVHPAAAREPELQVQRPEAQVELPEMLRALADVLRRASLFEHHQVAREPLSTRERMSEILGRVTTETYVPFVELFRVEEGRRGVVVTFMSIMELIKESLLDLVQNEVFGPIHVRARG